MRSSGINVRVIAAVMLTVAALGGCSWGERNNGAFDSTSPELDRAIAAYKAGRDEEAARLLMPLAQAGDPDAQTYLGILYREGRGVPLDNVEAVNWFYKA